jgi:hypothetical protein
MKTFPVPLRPTPFGPFFKLRGSRNTTPRGAVPLEGKALKLLWLNAACNTPIKLWRV